jgi:hypothetical protein
MMRRAGGESNVEDLAVGPWRFVRLPRLGAF